MQFTKESILKIAMTQSAVDAGCKPEDFLRQENVIVRSEVSPAARKYLELPFACNLISYGSNIVASVSDDCREAVEAYLRRTPIAHCFEPPGIHLFDAALAGKGLQTCFMAEYFLPDPEKLRPLSCPYTLRILTKPDFAALYRKEWSNALCEKRKELDMLAVGAFDGERLIGLAGCSADCSDMWQIGVDVLPEYRRRGVAAAVTARLALETFGREKLPFYCAAWSNIRSVRNALRCGFFPAWVELTVKSVSFVREMLAEKP